MKTMLATAGLLWGGVLFAAEEATRVVPCPDSPQPGIRLVAKGKADARNHWHYPAQARRNREQGTVTLKLMLDEQGSAQRVSLLQGSGSSLLDRAATAATKSPAVRFCILQGDAVVAAGVAVVKVTYSLTQTVAQL